MEFDLVIRNGTIIDGTGRPLSWPNILIRSLSGQSPKGVVDSERLIVVRMYYSARTGSKKKN